MIRYVIIDCDGVLTDGKKYVNAEGDRDRIAFHSRDNEAIKALQGAGYEVIILTSSQFSGIRDYWQKRYVNVVYTRDKGAIFHELGIDPAECLGVGDDFLDVPFLGQCAKAYVVADAHPTLLRVFPALEAEGGRGVMAEVWRLLVSDYSINEEMTTT